MKCYILPYTEYSVALPFTFLEVRLPGQRVRTVSSQVARLLIRIIRKWLQAEVLIIQFVYFRFRFHYTYTTGNCIVILVGRILFHSMLSLR